MKWDVMEWNSEKFILFRPSLGSVTEVLDDYLTLGVTPFETRSRNAILPDLQP